MTSIPVNKRSFSSEREHLQMRISQTVPRMPQNSSSQVCQREIYPPFVGTAQVEKGPRLPLEDDPPMNTSE